MIKKIGACIFLFALACAASAEPLQIQFEALKVRNDAQGTETFTPADQAAPGDLVEYRASFRNVSNKILHNLKPEIPVPVGMVVVPSSAKPRAVEGSLDGTVFKALPLLDAEGHPVPDDRIRALRWSLDELAPGESRQFLIRANVAR